MADYHAILKRALSSLPNPNGETRRAVYEKARTALVAQLKSFDPPLSPSEITQQRLQLEDAIRRVESEAAKGLLRAPPAAPPVRPPEPHTPAPTPEPEAAQGNAQPAAAPPEPPIRVAPPASQPEPDLPHPPAPSPLPSPTPPAPVRAASTPLEKVVGQAEALGGATAELGRQARSALLEGGSRNALEDGPRGTPDDKPRAPADDKPRPAPNDEPRPDAASNFARAGEMVPRKTETEARRRRREEVRTGEKKTSRLPMLVGVLVAGLVFAVGIVALWTQRDAISALLGGGAEPTIDLSKRDQKDVFTPKKPDRLPGADDPAAKVGPAKAVPTQTITTQPQIATPQGPASQGASSQSVAPQSATNQSGETKPAPLPEQAVVPVAQRVTLYEEGKAGGQAQITAGQIVWQTAPYLLDGKPGAVQIKAQIDIPERRIAAVMSIHPNLDPSFPASHLIELRFDLPVDFDGQSIKQVPGIIAKGSEQARGDGLVGASAKVSDNFFWIALGGAEADRLRNVKYLRERGWLDVPLLYENGRRAILTIEKAGAGDRVVSDALTSWGDGG